jgi:cytoskeletal protein RodZ
MDKKKFGKIMDQWIAHEMEDAPDLKPSPEVYRRLEEKKRKPRFAMFSWPIRLAAAGIAAALIILVIVIEPPKEVEPLLGLREGAVTDVAKKTEAEDRMQALGEAEMEELEPEEQAKDVPKPETAKMKKKVKDEVTGKGPEKKEYVAEEPPVKTEIAEKLETVERPKEADKEDLVQSKAVAARLRLEKAPEKKEAKDQLERSQIATVAAAAPAQKISERIEFQYHPKGSEAITKLDFTSTQEETISLTSDDNYRLVIQLPQEQYVYVYQVKDEKQLVRLFPNAGYNPAQNPLQAGKKIIIPSPPNWFYVGNETGEARVYMVTSPTPLIDWERNYVEYSQAGSARLKRDISAKFLDLVNEEKQDPEDQISIRVFNLIIR